jgi:transposase
LQSIVGDRNSPQKHVWRARIVLLSGDGIRTMAIMRAVGKAQNFGRRWQRRFMEEGGRG